MQDLHDVVCRCTYVVVLYHDVCVAVHSLHNKHLCGRGWSWNGSYLLLLNSNMFFFILLNATFENTRRSAIRQISSRENGSEKVSKCEKSDSIRLYLQDVTWFYYVPLIIR